MPRKESDAVPEGNGPVPQQEEFGSSQPTVAEVYRMFKERFDHSDRYLLGQYEEPLGSTGEEAWSRTLSSHVLP